ncbi:signal recognition particle protein [candidate division KSB3 bacterium]|uniref:Signal recognition particle protein n=1 Tax=candidate division KSB3 bacterium TaxID=2044937 RepID=A0A2G6E3G7_9BACT|nr:MAG: signal recognition particle protein [candidate division KSB3 bacterium]PIE29186.1 MAG: signal recognition particle protein [candidate division KSB3 bacterium]
MFDNLSEKLQSAFKTIRGHGKLSEHNIKSALKEVRMALLEADVNFRVVKNFTERVRKRAVGRDVLKSLTPGQQLIQVVNEELTELMGKEHVGLNFSGTSPCTVMMVGLQGSGKTTSTAKLARKLVQEQHTPMMVAADVYRPAAITQLQVLGEQLGITVFADAEAKDPRKICRRARQKAEEEGFDVLLIDTAGRLHIDQELMLELQDLKAVLSPQEILFVADAMTGQDAVTVAAQFKKDLDVTGVILTKLDGDARGGAALSIKAITDRPIKFVGMGEKLDQLENFHPERMASRILGMGDVLSFIEKVERSFDEKKAEELERKIREQNFSLEDFRDQLKQVREMGPLEQLLEMMPGMNKKALQNLQVDEKEFVRMEAIINSMTPRERLNHKILNGKRKLRVAKGSGTDVRDINKLLKQFEHARKMMKKLTGGGGRGSRRLSRRMSKGSRGRLPF